MLFGAGALGQTNGIGDLTMKVSWKEKDTCRFSKKERGSWAYKAAEKLDDDIWAQHGGPVHSSVMMKKTIEALKAAYSLGVADASSTYLKSTISLLDVAGVNSVARGNYKPKKQTKVKK